jgi:hypothetical protein
MLLHMFLFAFSDDMTYIDRMTTLRVRIESFVACIVVILITVVEPLRRGDLLNAINKLAGERGSAKHPLLRRPPAISQGFNVPIL